MKRPHPMDGIRPHIRDALIVVLKRTMDLGVDNYDAMEIYVRALVSVALDAAEGDCTQAARWMDEWLTPNLKHFRDHLAHGGRMRPDIIEGQETH